MGQRFFEDKIGALTESGGTITLAASRLTIGGQQYSTGNINIVPTLTANTRYYLYAVQTSGLVSLEVSTSDNGPVGFLSSKLVGAFRTDEVGEFYAFANLNSNGEILVESGKNTNGAWTRWADGTQECSWINPTLETPTLTTVVGSGISTYYVIGTWTYPIPFTSINSVVVTAQDHGGGVHFADISGNPGLNWTYYQLLGNNTPCRFMGFAKGRWK